MKIAEILTATKELINKPIVRLLVLAVLLLIVIFTSLEITKNPKANKFGPLSYSFNQTLGTEKMPGTKISFNFPKNIKIPPEANVYKIATENPDAARTFFDRVSRSLGATASAEIKTFGKERALVVSQNNFYFTGNLSTGYFSFTGQSSKKLDTSDTQSLKLSGWDLISLLGLNKNIDNTPSLSFYNYSGTELALSDNVSLAQVLELSYPFKINNITVIGLGSVSSSVAVYVDKKQKNIIRLDYSVPRVETANSSPYRLLSWAEITNTTPSDFNVVSFTNKVGEKIANYSLSNLSDVSFDSVLVAYYTTPELQNLLQPVFLLTGRARLTDQRSGTITAILPAVKNIKPTP